MFDGQDDYEQYDKCCWLSIDYLKNWQIEKLI